AEWHGIKSDLLTIGLQRDSEGPPFQLDPRGPCRWKKQHKFDDAASVWAFVERLEKHGARAHSVTLTAETESGNEAVEFIGGLETGYGGSQFRNICDQVQAIVGGQSGLRLKVLRVDFEAGQQLLDWLHATGQMLNP